ncbi:hypothetical protein RIR_jg42206.t1 [Rhizophagus irregularis DAOM 181602=DAOM 197198]|nr:hypothetical protein RIR_jg42206.t1 [Rhizophagus irregularis DAOM 181602=DAOM 197198]
MMVPDVRMMETTGSGRLDNGNRNEPVNSGRLDNELRNEPVPDVRMNETTGSGRLDNGNRNEPVPDVWIMEIKTNRFSPASTLALDIRYMNELEMRITHRSLDI